MACDTKIPKLVQIALTGIHRMITFEAVSHSAANNLVNCLWNLMENSIEELRILQTVTLLVSTNNIVQGLPLAKAIAICFRLNFTKNQSTNNAASATVRQVVGVVFERVIRFMRDEASYPQSRNPFEEEGCAVLHEELKHGSKNAPKSLQSMGIVSDAFMLFQDLIQLVKAEQPFWLNGLTEMTRTFGLELLEMIFSSFPEIFFKFEEFTFLLKEKICLLIIQLFSPNVKYKQQSLSNLHSNMPSSSVIVSPSDKPFYPISIRLLRILGVLLQKFHALLMTESEIFLNILTKFLDSDQPVWQKTVALEVIHKVISHPNLIKSFCTSYDMKPCSSKILRDLVSAITVFVQSHFIPSADTSSSLLSSLMGSTSVSSTGNPQSQDMVSTSSPGFSFRSTGIPLSFALKPGEIRSQYLDQLDKTEAPVIPEAVGFTTAYFCILDIIRGLFRLIDVNATPGDLIKGGPSFFSASEMSSAGPGSAVRASSSISSGNTTGKTSDKKDKIQELDSEIKAINETLISSTWPAILSCLTLFLETSNDTNITTTILKTMESLIGLLGVYNLNDGCNAFVTALCRSSLPSGPGFSALTYKLPQETCDVDDVAKGHMRSSSTSTDISTSSESAIQSVLCSNSNLIQQMFYQVPVAPWPPQPTTVATNQPEPTDPRLQIVIKGAGLSPSFRGSSTAIGPVLISTKQLLSMKSVLNIALNHGCILQESWYSVLLSLQHLVWILGLKPSSGGSLKSVRNDQSWEFVVTSTPNSCVTDLPVLTAMLSKLFSNSLQLDDEALVFLVESLIILSKESMELSDLSREPALFAIAKLLETGLVNLFRIDVVWKNLSKHLIHVCKHSNSKIREYATEALTTLVVASVSVTKGKLQSKDNLDSKFRFMAPLQDLSDIPFSDLRQKQLTVCLQLIQSTGERLEDAWPQMLDIIGSLHDSHSDSLIRLAFQCLQLIISDFLSNIPVICLVLVVETAAKFGSQTQELNVSLTAIGCLWNVADYLHHNQNRIRTDLAKGQQVNRPSIMESQLDPFECLWMGLFTRLGDLCCDSRPSVRKSAAQTLFSGLTTHADILQNPVWHPILWKVLFPVMDKVNLLMNEASDEKITDASKSMGMTGVGSSGSILLHHSRNTAYKQWAETQVLVLSGVCKVVSSKRELLASCLPDFDQAWRLILKNIESAASLSKNTEVSQSALACFQDLLSTQTKKSNQPANLTPLPESFWLDAWSSWSKIGEEVKSSSNQEVPSQAFLTSYVNIIPSILCNIKSSFNRDQFCKMASIFEDILKIPVDSTTQAFLVTMTASAVGQVSLESVNSTPTILPLTTLQEAIFNVIESFCSDFIAMVKTGGQKVSKDLLIPLFNVLISLFGLCSKRRLSNVSTSLLMSTPAAACNITNVSSPSNCRTIGSPSIDWITINYIPVGDKSLRLILLLYQHFAADQLVMREQVLHSIIRVSYLTFYFFGYVYLSLKSLSVIVEFYRSIDRERFVL